MAMFAAEAPIVPAPRPAAPVLRRFSPIAPRALLIGASTGGPQALAMVLSDASEWLRQIPIVVVLHMPPDFARVVACHIAAVSKMPARTAINGEKLLPGTIFFAPDSQHIRVMRAGTSLVLVHYDGPPQNFCKPSVDELFRSAAKSLKQETLGLVLTGMGRDGFLGAQAIADAGGSLIVQDEATSTVWGMPGAVARGGLASAILPLSGISSAIGGLLVAGQRRVAS